MDPTGPPKPTEAYFQEVQRRILKPKNDESAFRDLVREFPLYPTTWIAYATHLHKDQNRVEDALAMLRKAAVKLRSLEIWLALIEMEVEQQLDSLAKYTTIKAAVDDVGWDPRSFPLWDSFFTLFVQLHNAAVKQLANRPLESESLGTAGGAPLSTGPGTLGGIGPTVAVSSVAPLGSVEATSASYLQRTQGGDTDLSRFFTTADKTDFGEISGSLREALLKHPLRSESSELPLTEDASERLRELSSKGDLNLKVFQEYIIWFLVTPMPEIRRDISSARAMLDEDTRHSLDPVVDHIAKTRSQVYDRFPPSMFLLPSSPMHPEIDRLNVSPWIEYMKFECDDGWRIRDVNSGFWRRRVEFFFHSGCRACHYAPDIWFDRARFHFVAKNMSEGLRILETVWKAKIVEDLSWPIIMADAYEFLGQDIDRAANVLADAVEAVVMSHHLLGTSQIGDDAATPGGGGGTPKRLMTQTAQLPALVYHAMLRLYRKSGRACLEDSVLALLSDPSVECLKSEELLLMLVSLLTAASEASGGQPLPVLVRSPGPMTTRGESDMIDGLAPSVISGNEGVGMSSMDVVMECLLKMQDSPRLRMVRALIEHDELPKVLNYERCLMACTTPEGMLPIDESTRQLLTQVCSAAYYFSGNSLEVQRWLARHREAAASTEPISVKLEGMIDFQLPCLFTPKLDTSYQAYQTFCTDMKAGISAQLMAIGSPLTSAPTILQQPASSDDFVSIARASQKLDMLNETLTALLPTEEAIQLTESGDLSERVRVMQEILSRTIARAAQSNLISPVRQDHLRDMLTDENIVSLMMRWFKVQAQPDPTLS